jgi:hypothetical protein
MIATAMSPCPSGKGVDRSPAADFWSEAGGARIVQERFILFHFYFKRR